MLALQRGAFLVNFTGLGLRMWALGMTWVLPWVLACVSVLFLGVDPYEYIIMCFERKDIRMNKYEKGNICFSLLVCPKISRHI